MDDPDSLSEDKRHDGKQKHQGLAGPPGEFAMKTEQAPEEYNTAAQHPDPEE